MGGWHGQSYHLDFTSRKQTWLFVGGIVATLIVVGIIGAMANRAVARITGAGQLTQYGP